MLARLTADAEKYANEIQSIQSRRQQIASELDNLARQEAAAKQVHEYITNLLAAAPATTTATADKPKLSQSPSAIAARAARAKRKARSVAAVPDEAPLPNE